MNVLLDSDGCQLWREKCSSCSVNGSHILQKVVFVAGNCFLANKVKNYNSMVIFKNTEKRKLQKIPLNHSYSCVYS